MTNSKATKKALFMSMLSLLLCFTMLMGATFAWFTDTVKSSNNIIKAGNLDIELYYQVEGQTDWTKVDANSNIFKENALWEPGYTEVVRLKAVNEGSLALKYQLGVNVVSEETSINVDGGELKLSDHIKYGLIDNGNPVTRETAIAAVNADATPLATAYTSDVISLYPEGSEDGESEKIVTLVVYMPTTVDNVANHAKDAKIPTINLGLNVSATQLDAEEDSFGKDYDEEAFVADYYVNTASELVEAIGKAGIGNTIGLMGYVKIDPANMSNAYGTTGINIKNGQTIDGNGYTLDIKGAGGTWDSGINTTGGTIKNLTVTGSFRGIFINHNSTHSEPVILENVIIDGTTYTISCDQGMNQNLFAKNSTFNGWTSYAATLGKAEFVDCNFGEGNGYAYCRPYAPTTFIGCEFEAGYQMDARAAVTFENCKLGGVALTADNLATLVTSNTANATVK